MLQSVTLYRAIDVWRRVSETHVIRYRCFEVLSVGGYVVQSADSYHSPSADEPQHQAQFLELLLESPPEERSPVHSTLSEAIAAFDREFGNTFP